MSDRPILITWNGNRRECAGIAEAKAAVRAILAENALPDSVTVHVPAGIYSSEDFRFGAADCSPACRVRWEAAPGAVIQGGLSLPRALWEAPDEETAARFREEARGQVFCADLFRLGLSRGDLGEVQPIGRFHTADYYDDAPKGHDVSLFAQNGKTGETSRMTLARYPNAGNYEKIAAVADVGDVAEFPEQNYHDDWGNRRNQRGGAYILSKEMTARAAAWKEPETAWMFGYFYHDWADASTPVSFDLAHRTVFPAFVSRYGAQAGRNIYFYNIPEELDAPGEYYLDRRTGKLCFIPPEDTDLLLFACVPGALLSGDGAGNMTFSGFTLQAGIDDAILWKGDDVRFEKLTVRSVAGNAVVAEGYRNVVSDCEFFHLGKGGALMTGGDRATLTPGESRVTRCSIHHFGEIWQTYCPGVGLYGVGNRCDHNEIRETPHLAIYYDGNEHLIEYNHVHDAVLLSQDAGAIYGGRDWAGHGTVIRYNRIERIGSGEFRPDGIYWDDGLSGQTAYGNLIVGVPKFGFLVGGGRENVVRDNVIVNTDFPIYYDDRDRAGFLGYGWAMAAVNSENSTMWQTLKAVPYQSGIWAKKYPLLARLVCDLSMDPDDPDFAPNPSYAEVTGNIFIAPGRDMLAEPSVIRFGTVKDNLLFPTKEEAGFSEETMQFSPDSPVFAALPHFRNLPVAEMGIAE